MGCRSVDGKLAERLLNLVGIARLKLQARLDGFCDPCSAHSLNLLSASLVLTQLFYRRTVTTWSSSYSHQVVRSLLRMRSRFVHFSTRPNLHLVLVELVNQYRVESTGRLAGGQTTGSYVTSTRYASITFSERQPRRRPF